MGAYLILQVRGALAFQGQDFDPGLASWSETVLADRLIL